MNTPNENNVLFLQLSLEKFYSKESTTKENVDPYLTIAEDMMNNCEDLVNDLLQKWDMASSPAEQKNI